MRSKFVFLLFVVVLVFTVSPDTQLFAQLGFISGEVLDAEGKPIKDVTIRIEGMDSPRKYKLKTNDKGVYIHAGVAIQGIYRVIAQKEGYTGEYVENIKPGFTRNEERGTVNFKLTKGEARKLAFELTEEEIRAIQQENKRREEQRAKMAAIQEDFNAAVAFYNAEQYEEAITSFLKVIETDDSQPVVWANLASAYHRMDNLDKALEAYDKALELDPGNSSYLQNKGSIYAALGEPAKARELYEQAASSSAQLNPKDAAINYYNMGVTYINAGQSQEAADALKKAIELDPDHAESHYQLGITLIGLGNMEEAISYLKKYIEISPGSENAQVAQALIEQLGG